MIWYPYEQMKTMKAPYKIIKAKGVHLYTEDQELIDSVSSWWCMIHGYQHPELTAAIQEQAANFCHVMLGGLTHDPVEKLSAKLEEFLAGVNAFNAKGKAAEIGAFLDKYIPAVEQMHTTLKKYNTAFTATIAENKKLKKKAEQLAQSLDKATQESTLKKLADAKLHRDYEDAVAVLDRIPKEVLAAYTHRTEKERETAYGR